MPAISNKAWQSFEVKIFENLSPTVWKAARVRLDEDEASRLTIDHGEHRIKGCHNANSYHCQLPVLRSYPVTRAEITNSYHRLAHLQCCLEDALARGNDTLLASGHLDRLWQPWLHHRFQTDAFVIPRHRTDCRIPENYLCLLTQSSRLSFCFLSNRSWRLRLTN